MNKLLNEFEEILRLREFTSDNETERELNHSVNMKIDEITRYKENNKMSYKELATEIEKVGGASQMSLLHPLYEATIMFMSIIEERNGEED